MACSDFVIAPSTQLKLDPYSINKTRDAQWSLIAQPSLRLLFSVKTADGPQLTQATGPDRAE